MCLYCMVLSEHSPKNLAERNGWKHGERRNLRSHESASVLQAKWCRNSGITYHPHFSDWRCLIFIVYFPLFYIPRSCFFFFLQRGVGRGLAADTQASFFSLLFAPTFFFLVTRFLPIGTRVWIDAWASSCYEMKKEWHLASFFGSESVELIFYGAGGMALLKGGHVCFSYCSLSVWMLWGLLPTIDWPDLTWDRKKEKRLADLVSLSCGCNEERYSLLTTTFLNG